MNWVWSLDGVMRSELRYSYDDKIGWIWEKNC